MRSATATTALKRSARLSDSPPMSARRLFVVLVALVAALPNARLAAATPFPGAPACPTFPADSFWHADVSHLPVSPQSAGWVTSIGTAAKLKADFGAGIWDGGPIGIPFTTVPGTQPRVPVSFYYGNQSDPGPYPLPPDAPIEGGSASTGDRHVLVVDRDACRLWEVYDAHPQNGGSSWTAGSGATWDLRSNAMRTLGWTSGDAAGLPILPGLVRRDEVAAGEIDHVIRFTAHLTSDAYVWPASHKAATGGASDPPMGAWFRLKGDYDISGYSPDNQVILRALKKHGMVLADNGSSWFMSGAPDPGWNDDDLQLLRQVPGSAFEAVDVSSLETSPSSYAVAGTTHRPADFDGDGRSDRSVFRPSSGGWYAAGGQPAAVPFGASGDIPVPGDYNGDGRTEPAVFRPSTGAWYITGPPAASPLPSPVKSERTALPS